MLIRKLLPIAAIALSLTACVKLEDSDDMAPKTRQKMQVDNAFILDDAGAFNV